jgi:hypothetical protein
MACNRINEKMILPPMLTRWKMGLSGETTCKRESIREGEIAATIMMGASTIYRTSIPRATICRWRNGRGGR